LGKGVEKTPRDCRAGVARTVRTRAPSWFQIETRDGGGDLEKKESRYEKITPHGQTSSSNGRKGEKGRVTTRETGRSREKKIEKRGSGSHNGRSGKKEDNQHGSALDGKKKRSSRQTRSKSRPGVATVYPTRVQEQDKSRSGNRPRRIKHEMGSGEIEGTKAPKVYSEFRAALSPAESRTHRPARGGR